MNTTVRNLLVTASILGALAVVLGALGAHALRTVLAEAQLDSFETGVRYHLVHTVALLGLAALYPRLNPRWARWTGRLFITGILLFSGSIYLLSTRQLMGLDFLRFLGPVTPVGGLLLIAGWITCALAAWRVPH